MAYKLDLTVSIEDAVRSLGVEQLGNAQKRLIAKKTPTAGVHEARKNLKKSRSLLRLIKPAISKKVFKETNMRLRDIARRLAGTRDIQAMVETIVRIQAHFSLTDDDLIIKKLLETLADKKFEAEKNLKENSENEIIDELGAAKDTFETLELREDSIESILLGFAETYANGKLNMELAYEEIDIEAFHEWRKFLQHHWRQLQLLTPIWPEMLDIHVSQAEEISQILGNHNDLSILIDFIEDNREDLGSKAKTRKFLKVCDGWRVDLRAEVHPFGRRAYAESATAISSRFKSYWEVAQTATSE